MCLLPADWLILSISCHDIPALFTYRHGFCTSNKRSDIPLSQYVFNMNIKL